MEAEFGSGDAPFTIVEYEGERLWVYDDMEVTAAAKHGQSDNLSEGDRVVIMSEEGADLDTGTVTVLENDMFTADLDGGGDATMLYSDEGSVWKRA